MNPYVFIVGCPRSGTTLLRRMANAHPQLAITRETHWIPDLYEADDHLAALLAHPKFQNLRLDREELEQIDAAAGYAEFVRAVFDLYGAKQGKPFVGDKTPGYVRELRLLAGLFPHARFVHLIRDGRDVCLSATNWDRKAEQFRRRFSTWDEDPVTTAALWWRWHVERGRAHGLPLGPERYYELRYEELVDEPEAACRRLFEFLALPFDDAVLRFHEGRIKHDAGLSAKHAWLPPTPGLRDWRTEMSEDELERFEAAAGDLLDELGYRRATTEPRPERRASATRIAALFAKDAP